MSDIFIKRNKITNYTPNRYKGDTGMEAMDGCLD
jgi:hypothetical protein